MKLGAVTGRLILGARFGIGGWYYYWGMAFGTQGWDMELGTRIWNWRLVLRACIWNWGLAYGTGDWY